MYDVDEALGIKKPATEETLQSIDSTLKRIEKLLKEKLDANVVMDGVKDALTKAVVQI